MGKNPQALTLAFKKCKGKIAKIKELGITPEIDKDAVEVIIETLATDKAVEAKATGAKDAKTKMSDHVKGQRWYVEELVKFSALTNTEQLEAEYVEAFADTASEAEMLKALESMAA